MATKKKVSKKKVAKKKAAKRKPYVKGITRKKKRTSTKSNVDFGKTDNNSMQNDLVYTNTTGKPSTGRPPKSASLKQIKSLAAIGCTNQETAAILGMNKDTFSNLKLNNPIVAEVIEAGRAEGKGSIRRKQHEVALRGDTSMLKWLGKNRLGQSERIISHLETSTGDTLRKALMGDVDEDEDEDDL